ncbi:SDR family NAD(P)-dependent oxidoreductase [uncultured Sphingomonas sp.]|uniref:SDR family NAD(P)-dependent oxidoreductase n=1 Tax=uncultured Sphingomonas sp. TaxID=158754 RepID=UPI0035CB988B
MPGPLDGKLALVTGASRGIGAATATALGLAGAHVVLTARTAAGLEEVEQAIFDAGGSATIAPLDLTQTDAIARLAAAVGERWRALDVMVLNAAMLGALTPVPSIDPKELAQILTLNVSAQVALLTAFDPMLRASDDARVIGVTSSVGRSPRAYWGAYGASKAAFENIVLAYGDELANIGRVRTMILDPGATRTRMRENAFPGEDPLSVKEPAVVAGRIAELAVAGFEQARFERISV